MKKVMFTKHLEGYDIGRIIESFASIGIEGADLCTRPDCPVSPENCEQAMPAAAKQFADAGMSIQICTTPGDFTDPAIDYADRLYAACGASGVRAIKLGYWHWSPEVRYWQHLDEIRRYMEGFAKLSEKHGVKTVVHNHSGHSMGLNSVAAMNIVKGFDPEHIGIFTDPGHLSLCGEPIDMALDIVRDYVSILAFKDILLQRSLTEPPGRPSQKVMRMGQGLVNWPLVVEGLRGLDFNGPVSFHSEYAGETPQTVVDLARIDVRFFNSLLAATD